MSNQAQSINLADYQEANFLVEKINLKFELDLENTLVTSEVFLQKNPIYTQHKHLELNGEELEIVCLKIDDKQLQDADFTYTQNLLKIANPPQSGTFCLTSQVKINPSANTQLSGLYKSSTMLSTQCEAEGFRRITFYPDRPDVLAKFTTTLIANKAKAPILLSNGNLIASGDLEDGKHFATWEDPFKKPCYLFALVAGDLVCVEDSYTTSLSKKDIKLQIFIEPENKHKSKYALESLKNAMLWDEQNYGREYDLDTFMIVAVSDFNMGAMENKGLNIFNTSAVLADEISSTDASFRRVESVVGHEYFHNWTGNRITCRDWFQLSLKEGFTVFREQSFAAAMNGKAVQRIEDVNLLRAVQFAEDAGALSHPVRPASYIEINNFYTTTIYEKGAEVIRMLSSLVDPATFRKATDLYFAKYDGMAVRVEELIGCVQEASGLDLSQFILWYTQAGTPIVKGNGAYDASKQTFTLTLEQQAPFNYPQNEPLLIPIDIALFNKTTQAPIDLISNGENFGKNRILRLETKSEEFVFENVEAEVIPSLLRNFSAPIKLNYDYTKADLGFLMAEDTDEFNRWEAGQKLYLANILDIFDGKTQGLDQVLQTALTSLFEQEIKNPEILSLIFSLPTYAFLVQTQEKIEPIKMQKSLKNLKTLIGKTFYTQWKNLYEKSVAELEKITDFYKQIGWRKLKNLSLSYILESEKSADLDLVVKQFEDKSKGMTDRFSALVFLLEWAEDSKYSMALKQFREEWSKDLLVMDMWFSAQAGRRKASLQDIENLFADADFNIKNPNRLRSVLVPFASNPLNFHREDGSGYEFFVDKIIEVDKLNSQMSAGLTKKLADWNRYAQPYAEKMRAQLERLSRTSTSVDVYEILDKSLKN